MTGRERLTAFVAAQREDLLRAAEQVRLSEDIEAVHDFRVATRRLRTVLRSAPAFFEAEWADRVQAELDRLGPAFGPLRDFDVFVERLREDASTLDDDDRAALEPVFELLAKDRGAARAAALAELDAPVFAQLTEALAAPALVDTDEPLDAVEVREVRRLRKAMDQIDRNAPDELLHRARIRAKRVRYVAEALEDDRVVKRAKELQDVAGEHQDAVVAEEKLRVLAERVPTAAFQLGRLVEREHERRSESRSGLRRAWKRLAKAAPAS